MKFTLNFTKSSLLMKAEIIKGITDFIVKIAIKYRAPICLYNIEKDINKINFKYL